MRRGIREASWGAFRFFGTCLRVFRLTSTWRRPAFVRALRAFRDDLVVTSYEAANFYGLAAAWAASVAGIVYVGAQKRTAYADPLKKKAA